MRGGRRRVPYLAATALLAGGTLSAQPRLESAEVDRIVRQAAAEARRVGLSAHIAVTDAEGNILARFRMEGAPDTTVVRPLPGEPGRRGNGLEGDRLPASFAAVSKAGTGAFLSTGGHAFSTRTASFIIQDHFPPRVEQTPGGPLFGVQFSSLPCTDFKVSAAGASGLPAGLSGDPGGLPLYKDGLVAGAIGVEGDGLYTVDDDPADLDVSAEELAALAGARGFEPPEGIRAEFILADGIRLPYANGEPGSGGDASGAPGVYLDGPRGGLPRVFVPISIGGLQGAFDPRFPVRSGQRLSDEDVTRILTQAATQAAKTRAAIRRPLGSPAQVSIVVVDVDGRPLGNLRTADAPVFGFDVAVQKARTANFFSSPDAGETLRRAGFAFYLDSEVPLNGSVAYSTRAVGFLAQPFFPPGIAGTDSGPLAPPAGEWSAFNTGLQFDLVEDAVRQFLATLTPPGRCSVSVPQLANGITIFPGGVPLYKNGRLAGAIGISGDGVDQDDLIASAGSAGFEASPDIRSDRITVRGVRLPWVKFPRHPDL
jgi:uncharacterized protein GlcG (DUF336 family)